MVSKAGVFKVKVNAHLGINLKHPAALAGTRCTDKHGMLVGRMQLEMWVMMCFQILQWLHIGLMIVFNGLAVQ